jgi:uncharacterized protein YecE (DUF72 family)
MLENHALALERLTTMIWIGTSGYQYKEWKGKFYPEKMSLPKMLAFYAERFPTMEIIYTSRHLPSDETLDNWLAQTPEQFRFTLKAPERITHHRRLKDCEPVLQSFADAALKLGPKLGALLFQLPPQFKCDLPVLETFLASVPKSLVAAFEFRHASWFTDSVFDALRRHNATLCIADTTELTTPTVFTNTTGYFRLRRLPYSTDDLRHWAETIRDHAARLADIYVYFKHEETCAGPRLAKDLMGMLGLNQADGGTTQSIPGSKQ